MILKRLLIIGAILTMLFGCAASPELQATQAEFRRTIPTCSGAEDCNEKWEAAQLWVVKNSGWKIQTQSNVLIETYNATGGSTRIAVRVTKEPLGGGKYQFIVNVWCDNIFGCQPNAWDAALDFNRQISSINNTFNNSAPDASGKIINTENPSFRSLPVINEKCKNRYSLNFDPKICEGNLN